MMPLKAPLTAFVLLVICLLATNTSAAYYGCCRSYTKHKIPCKVIKGYSVQTENEMCPINAIIFHTKKGRACTNPALPWVMECVEKLRNKALMVHRNTSRV